MRTRAEIRNDLNDNEDTMRSLRAKRTALVEELRALEASESVVHVNDTVWIGLSRYVKHQYVMQWHKAIVLAIGTVTEGSSRPELVRVRRYKADGTLAKATLQTRNWRLPSEHAMALAAEGVLSP